MRTVTKQVVASLIGGNNHESVLLFYLHELKDIHAKEHIERQVLQDRDTMIFNDDPNKLNIRIYSAG